MSVSLAKMNAYLRKITKEMGLEIDPQRIMGQDLCKINKHFLQFPYKIDLNRIDRFTFESQKKSLEGMLHSLALWARLP
jgi:hypothetical protein